MQIKLTDFAVYADQELGSPQHLGFVASNSAENALVKADKLYPRPTKEIVVVDNKREIVRTVSTLFVRKV